MSTSISQKHIARHRRHVRIRARVHGTAKRPRLAVTRSLKHIRVQLVNDDAKRTLAQATDAAMKRGTKTERAAAVGTAIAAAATSLKITAVVFDRGGYKYHGRIKALADAARTAGLLF